MTEKPWNIGEPGGPAGPFYSVVKPNGNIVAMQILTREMAELIANIPVLQAEVERLRVAIAEAHAVVGDAILSRETAEAQRILREALRQG